MVLDSDIFETFTSFFTSSHVSLVYELFVCLLLVTESMTESHGQRKGASRDSELRLLAEMSYLINNSECFETLTTKPPTNTLSDFFQKLYTYLLKLIIPFFNCVGT